MKTKKYVSLFLVLLLTVSVLSVSALAEDGAAEEPVAEEPDAAESGYDFIFNDMDCTYYNNDGRIVFNNHGIVYNNGNGGVVYNNGGTVYNNGGTVYNNCGTVYNNSGTAFNNCGEVVNSGDGIVVDNTAVAAITEAEEIDGPVSNGRYKISLAADYGKFAYIEGPDKAGLDYFMDKDSEIIITAKPGYSLLSSMADTGRCTLQEDGSVIFSGAEKDGTLTLAFKVDEPVIRPEFGTYGEAVTVKIILPKGVTVYYTTDGTAVSEESAVVDGPMEISTSTTLEVLAVSEGAQNSQVVVGRYLIPIIKAPQFEPLEKGYEPVEPQAVSVENTGLDRLKIESVKLTGIDANCFVLNTEEGARLDPGQNSRDTWTVAPVDALNTGTYEAAVEFTFENGNTALADLSFTVTKP